MKPSKSLGLNILPTVRSSPDNTYCPPFPITSAGSANPYSNVPPVTVPSLTSVCSVPLYLRFSFAVGGVITVADANETVYIS